MVIAKLILIILIDHWSLKILCPLQTIITSTITSNITITIIITISTITNTITIKQASEFT